jgi:hypothetical protein
MTEYKKTYRLAFFFGAALPPAASSSARASSRSSALRAASASALALRSAARPSFLARSEADFESACYDVTTKMRFSTFVIVSPRGVLGCLGPGANFRRLLRVLAVARLDRARVLAFALWRHSVGLVFWSFFPLLF